MDARMQYCRCGYSFIPSFFMKLLMLVRGEYNMTCPQCGSVMKFVLVNHVVKTGVIENKNREKLWEYG